MEAATPPAARPPTARFEVTGQEHLTRYDANQGQVGYWHIHFKTPSGIDSFVTVDDTQYNPEHLHDLISRKVHDIETVQHLGK